MHIYFHTSFVFPTAIFLPCIFLWTSETMHIKYTIVAVVGVAVSISFFDAFHFHFHYSLQLEYQLIRVKRGNVALYTASMHAAHMAVNNTYTFVVNQGNSNNKNQRHNSHKWRNNKWIMSRSTWIIYEEATASATINLRKIRQLNLNSIHFW